MALDYIHNDVKERMHYEICELAEEKDKFTTLLLEESLNKVNVYFLEILYYTNVRKTPFSW